MQEGTYIKPGQDDTYKAAGKIADIRRIVDGTVEALISSKQLTPEQEKTAQQLVDKVHQLVPYTFNDVVKARFPGGKQTSIGEASRAAVSGSSGPKNGDTRTSKSGKPIVFRNGNWEYQ